MILAKIDHAVNRFVLHAAPDWKLLRARRDAFYGEALGVRLLAEAESRGLRPLVSPTLNEERGGAPRAQSGRPEQHTTGNGARLGS